MPLRRRDLLAASSLLASGSAGAQSLQALKPADFPTRPIEFVVAFPAGGGMDVAARLLARQVEKISGQRILVTNRTGGAGLVAHAFLARQAAPDGYTVGIFSNGLFSDSMLRAEGRWNHTDLELIGFLNLDPMNWIVASRGPLAEANIQQILAIGKDRPGTLRVTILPQRPSEFLVEQVETRSGGRYVKVPFQGGAPGVTALIGNNVEIAVAFYSEYRGQMEAGLVRPVAISGANRLPTMPEVPTFNEVLGTDNILWAAWRFAVVPKAVPADRRRYLEAIIGAALRDPELIEEFARTGAVMDPAIDSPETVRRAAAQLIAAEQGFYRESGRLR